MSRRQPLPGIQCPPRRGGCHGPSVSQTPRISRRSITFPCVGPEAARCGIGRPAQLTNRLTDDDGAQHLQMQLQPPAGEEGPLCYPVFTVPQTTMRVLQPPTGSRHPFLDTPIIQRPRPDNRPGLLNNAPSLVGQDLWHSSLKHIRFQKSSCRALELRRAASSGRQPRSQIKGKLSEWLMARPWLPRRLQGPGRRLLLRPLIAGFG
jgi:hypothetical protein